MIHRVLVEFLIFQFTSIFFIYLQIEDISLFIFQIEKKKNDKNPQVNWKRVKYEQFTNFIDKIYFVQISISPSLTMPYLPSVS